MNVLRTIENIRKDVLNFEDMFIESDMPDCFSRIYESENPTVSARELHEALGVASRFSRWFDSNKDLFIEGEDYNKCTSSTVVNNGAIRELEDYSMSVLMAKHICLMSRTEKGKRCRDYLIDLEKAWNTPEQIFARALKMADKTIESLKKDNAVLIEDNERMKPKEIFADAVSANICVHHGMQKRVYDANFESFWSVYPRKKEKAKAYQCYNARLNDGFSEDELLTAASKYAEECRKRKTDERYIKLGSTFLGANTPFVDYLNKRSNADETEEYRRPAADLYREFMSGRND